MTTRASHTLSSVYLGFGTPPSALSSHAILAVLQPEETEARRNELGVLRSVTLKVKESAANERPAISRPARDAREVLEEMAADGEESLVGVF